MTTRAESGSWNNLAVRLPGCAGSFVGELSAALPKPAPSACAMQWPHPHGVNGRLRHIMSWMGETLCRACMVSFPGGGVFQSGRWGLSFILDEEKNWGSAAVGWSVAPAKELGFRWPGNELSVGCPAAQLRVIKPGMTWHSRTRCKSSSDEFTNKMPMVLNSRRHVSPSGCSSSAWRGEQPWRGRHCSLRLCWHGAQLLSSRDPGECCAGQTGGCCL